MHSRQVKVPADWQSRFRGSSKLRRRFGADFIGSDLTARMFLPWPSLEDQSKE